MRYSNVASGTRSKARLRYAALGIGGALLIASVGCKKQVRSTATAPADAHTQPNPTASRSTTAQPSPGLLGGERGLDHVGIAVSNLEAAKATYQRVLGFNRPIAGKLPNGLKNVNFYFEDATYLETVTHWDRKKAAWLAEFTDRHRQGGLFLVLSVASIEGTTKFLSRRGFSMSTPIAGSITVDHQRAKKRSGGQWQTLFFNQSPLPGRPIYFIAYPRLSREAYLNRLKDKRVRRAAFRHRNTAVGIKVVWMAVRDLDQAAKIYASIGLSPGRAFVHPRLKVPGRLVQAGLGQILLLAPAVAAGSTAKSKKKPDRPAARGQQDPIARFLEQRGPGLIGLTVGALSVQAAQLLLSRALGAELTSYRGPIGKSILIPPEHTHGVWLEFAQVPRTEI